MDSALDMCVFLGETFDLSCSGDDNTPINVTFDGFIFNGPVVVNENLDNITFQCQTESNTPCDLANEHTLRVFGT